MWLALQLGFGFIGSTSFSRSLKTKTGKTKRVFPQNQDRTRLPNKICPRSQQPPAKDKPRTAARTGQNKQKAATGCRGNAEGNQI